MAAQVSRLVLDLDRCSTHVWLLRVLERIPRREGLGFESGSALVAVIALVMILIVVTIGSVIS